MRILLIILFASLLSSCSVFQPYKPDLQQGNIITPTMVKNLHTGMTPQEVVSTMGGQPVLQNAYQDGTLNYVYTFEASKGKLTKKKLVLTFKNGKLVTISK